MVLDLEDRRQDGKTGVEICQCVGGQNKENDDVIGGAGEGCREVS